MFKEPDQNFTIELLDLGASQRPASSKFVLFDYTFSRAQEVSLRLLEIHRRYVMTEATSAKNVGVAAKFRTSGVHDAKSAAQGEIRRTNLALTMINKLFSIECDLKDISDEQRFFD